MEFGDYLRTLIHKRNVSVSAVARGCGIERTLLFRAMTGQRVLPAYSLSELIYFLKLGPKEKRRLYAYYNQLFEEEDIRNCRKQIEKLFSRLAGLKISAPAADKEVGKTAGQFPGRPFLIYGENEIHRLLQTAFAEEAARGDACLDLLLPALNEQGGESFDLASYGVKPDGTCMEIRQIFCFDRKDPIGIPGQNKIDCFCRSFRLSLLLGQHYQSWYYYGKDWGWNGPTFAPFPYFAVTHDYVICMTSDKKAAMLLRNEEQILHYRWFFQRLTGRCYRFTSYLGGFSEVMDFYRNCAESGGLYMIMPQTFIWGSIADERIKKQMLSAFRVNAGRVGIIQEDFFPEYLSVCAAKNQGIAFLVGDRISQPGGLRGIRLHEPDLCGAIHSWLADLFDGGLALTAEESAEASEELAEPRPAPGF